MLRDPRCLNDKLTLLFELHQVRRIRSHFLDQIVKNEPKLGISSAMLLTALL